MFALSSPCMLLRAAIVCALSSFIMAVKNWAITFNSHTLFPVDNI